MTDEQATAIVTAILVASTLKTAEHPLALGNYTSQETLSGAFELARAIVRGARVTK